MAILVNSKKKQAKKSFQELINDLMTSGSEKVRYNAARILGEMGDSKAVEPLIDVLKNDKNGSVRLYAARALGELGDINATNPLIESLREDRNVDVRVRAARALGRLGGKIVVEPLVEALNDENPQVCITATDALIEIGDVATDALMNSLDHEKVNVRCDATRALGEIGNKKCVDKIINMLYDEWVNVRIYAVTFLVMGYDVINSMFFTSCGEAKSSAIISSLRGIVLLLGFIFILSAIFGMTGVWMSGPCTELLTAVVSVFLIRKFKRSSVRGAWVNS